jgi:hypothetical protein
MNWNYLTAAQEPFVSIEPSALTFRPVLFFTRVLGTRDYR